MEGHLEAKSTQQSSNDWQRESQKQFSVDSPHTLQQLDGEGTQIDGDSVCVGESLVGLGDGIRDGIFDLDGVSLDWIEG